MAALAADLPCQVEWHPGHRLAVAELRRHRDYRGAEVVALGVALAGSGDLDAAVIGAAALTDDDDPGVLKRLWHCVARFGRPCHSGDHEAHVAPDR